MTKNLEKSVVYSIKLIHIELLDIEEEGSDFEGLGVRATRSVKTRPVQAPMGKGPILDQTYRVMKSKEMRESVLLSMKSMRLGRYGRNAYIQGINEDEVDELQQAT